jgi:hypothetical protein
MGTQQPRKSSSHVQSPNAMPKNLRIHGEGDLKAQQVEAAQLRTQSQSQIGMISSGGTGPAGSNAATAAKY